MTSRVRKGRLSVESQYWELILAAVGPVAC